MPREATLSDFGFSFEQLIQQANNSREATERLGTELRQLAGETQRNGQVISAVIEALTGNMAKMQTEASNIVTALNGISSALARNRPQVTQAAATMNDVWEVYRKMEVEVDELQASLKALNLTQKEMNKVVQLGTDYNEQRNDSYAALSEKYRAIKILIDNMTRAERENTQAGRDLVTESRRIYEQMNLLQQATGKYQLQVGNYSKAMTGLNIATNQVVRELPVLANGVSMFAIAISNNVPIWADAISQVNKEYKLLSSERAKHLEAARKAAEAGDLAKKALEEEAAAAINAVKPIRALASSLLSWQTGLVLIMTVLPAIIRKIQEKKKAQEEEKKAQEEATKATEEASEKLKTLDETYREIRSSIEGEVTELKTLDVILNDTNRSWEDRVNAGRRLKQIFDEELEGFSAEDIAMGNATAKMKALTLEVYNQAKARASLNKITELTQQIISLEGDANLYGNWRAGTKTIKEFADELDRANAAGEKIRIGSIEMEYVEKYKSILREMNSYQYQIDELIDQINPADLLEKITENGRKKGKADKGLNIVDYYYEMLLASAQALPGELERQLAVLETGWMKERDELAEHIGDLANMREKANADEVEEINQQIQNLLIMLRLGQDKYDSEVKRIIKERIDSYAEEVVEDAVAEDIPGKIEQKLRRGRKYGGIVEAILAQTKTYGEKNKYGQQVIQEAYYNFVTSVDQALKTSMGFMDEWMDKRLEMAKIAVEAAEKEVAAAQKVLDFEMEARANGYANRVETARKELDLEREQHRKALEEQKRLQEQQLLFDSISQTSSLITATANIWEAMTKGTGPLGPGLAIAATALLWGSFAAAKIKAKELAGLQAEQYGEGTVELLEGGSHASGHDIDLGRKKDGTPRRAEGGEFFAVINKRNSRRFRSVIPDVINSFNDGTFGEKYQKANEAMGNFALGLLAGNSPTDVSALERDVHAIKEQGDEHRYMDSMGNTIIRYKNLTRKISKS